MQCTLEPFGTDSGPLEISGEAARTLGRGRECDLKVDHPKISRHHCSLRLAPPLALKVEADSKPLCFQRAGDSKLKRVDGFVELRDGDILYLLANRACCYKVCITGAAPTRKRKAAEPTGRGVFSGCQLAFWHVQHATVMKTRALASGATVEEEISETTTHCVCPGNWTAVQAAARFARCPPDRDCVRVTLQGAELALPTRVHFVTPTWVSDSLLRGRLQDEEKNEYWPKWYGCAVQQLRQDMEKQAAVATAANVKATQALSPRALRAASQLEEEQPGGAVVCDRSEPCVVVRRGGDWIAVRGQKPRYTGGDTGIPWGTCGVWDEPFDEAAARATVERLRASWYTLPRASPGPASPVAASAAASATNGICEHPACSALAYCIVAKLNEVKAAYLPGGRANPFKIKAVEKAMQEVAQHPTPLISALDVDAVAGLGGKSADKVKEIVSKGYTTRMQILMADPRHQALSQFTRVWGVGAATASQWYNAGARTLEEVAARAEELHLTAQQRCGLLHVDDFEQRIPRDEIVAVEAMLRDRVFSRLERMGATEIERTYCHVTGSYARGELDSADIDLLTCLPPSMPHADCGAFLGSLLAGLRREDFLTAEMEPKERMPVEGQSATWLGVCRPAGSPCCRRIDFKVYPGTLAPYASAYFANEHRAVRALRLHASKDAEDARHYNPAATGFRLTDQALVPVRRDGAATNEVVLGPAVACYSESDIFRALGLAFVPVTMRKFTETAAAATGAAAG